MDDEIAALKTRHNDRIGPRRWKRMIFCGEPTKAKCRHWTVSVASKFEKLFVPVAVARDIRLLRCAGRRVCRNDE